MTNQFKQQTASIENLRESLVPVRSGISVDIFDNFGPDVDEGLYLYIDWEMKQIFFTVLNDKSPERDIEGQGALYGVDRLFSPIDYSYSETGYDASRPESFNKCLHDYVLGKAIFAQEVLDSARETDDEDMLEFKLSKILDPYQGLIPYQNLSNS